MTQWGFVGTTGYQVSDQGDVMSRFGRPLKCGVRRVGRRSAPKWYRFAYIPGRGQVKVAQLVLEVFVGPKLPGQQIRHLDDNSLNDCLGNLAWGTRSDNMRDRVRNGNQPINFPDQKGSGNNSAKLSEGQVLDIREAAAQGVRHIRLAEQYGVHQTTISGIVRRRYWAHV